VVSQTGFVPNGMAGSLRTSRVRLVAAVLPTLTSPVFQETIQALNQALQQQGYQLMIGQSGYDAASEDQLLDAIIRRRPDGIVLTGILHSAAGRRQLLASGIPVIETWDLTPTPIDMLVGFSHEHIGAELCRYLHQRGYRRPALLSADDERALRRMAGFQRAASADHRAHRWQPHRTDRRAVHRRPGRRATGRTTDRRHRLRDHRARQLLKARSSGTTSNTSPGLVPIPHLSTASAIPACDFHRPQAEIG
jgi:DNA-binding LacI/PurR family transcriptional regulator